ncbi:hypothetical protein CPB83DRAFT_776285 [Crepidotus variabilis]|uniref:HTH CENPB-type domain-containing protein n=1 Tax=Crepidotus variabilis TaxID=179855 RepID=A0A9P6E5K0_9AGAR|nr:hypothetical protein CPB83DRAFT_776285 [Crepidotus variabilis]
MALYDRAVLAYRAELAKPKGEKRHGLRAVCIAIEKLHFEETGKVVKLHHTRLNHYVDGGKTGVEAKAHRAWLTDAEEKIVVDFAIEMAWRGFPLSHGRLKDHVDLMAAARLGRAFPEEGIGRCWTTRFITRHSD